MHHDKYYLYVFLKKIPMEMTWGAIATSFDGNWHTNHKPRIESFSYISYIFSSNPIHTDDKFQAEIAIVMCILSV